MDVTTHQHLTRQLDLIPIESLSTPVTIIGCGAIGSFTALALAKMGLRNITVYDYDSVSVENMSNQFFRFADIGTNKAEALYSLVFDFTKTQLTAYPRAFMPEDAATCNGIVISAVDSMDARRMIFDAILDTGFNVNYIIDPRMGAESYSQYTMKPFDEDDQATYNKTLYSDADSVQERCTAKSTVYTATLAAGLCTKTVKNIMLNQRYPRNTQWAIAHSNNPMLMFPSLEVSYEGTV